LDVAEHGNAGFQSGLVFDPLGDELTDAAEPYRVGTLLVHFLHRKLAVLRARPFRNAHDAELGAFAPLEHRIKDRIPGERYLRDENDVGPAGNPGAERDPSGIAPHRLHDHHAVVSGGGCLQAVNSFGCHGAR
jgi:hypothetical protein